MHRLSFFACVSLSLIGLGCAKGSRLVQCGDGIRDVTELCDTAIPAGEPGACPTTCEACSTLAGTGCEAKCEPVACAGGDSCCVLGCDSTADTDCTNTCNNGVLENPETCDGDCVTTCDDEDACTTEVLEGDPGHCNVRCSRTPIAACRNNDGCCAEGCTESEDDDCAPSCGNGIVEPGEICDGNCPTSCSDGNACTSDVPTGSAEQCNLECSNPAITTCVAGDGCCPSSCNATNDGDCGVSYCTLVYTLTPQFRVTNAASPSNITTTLPEGKLVLRMEASGGSPAIGGTVELAFLWVDVEPTQEGRACFAIILCSNFDIDWNSNLFAATCSGDANPSTSSPPDPCDYTDMTTTGATGDFNGTEVIWRTCARHSNYGGSGYTAGNAGSSTGPGCMQNVRWVGNVDCASTDLACGDYGWDGGGNDVNTTFNQPLETITFSNGFQNISMPYIAIPEDRFGATSIQFTGIRSGGTCN